MSYAFLFKYIIIGDTGKSFASKIKVRQLAKERKFCQVGSNVD